jgi:flagellar biosynthesis protein
MSERDVPEAVALRHGRGSRDAEPSSAPRVVAKGRGVLAERILELAREHDVPVRSDRDLVELLSACELGDEIPVEVWTAVAELLAWLWSMREAG